jgi:hypothetical protein
MATIEWAVPSRTFTDVPSHRLGNSPLRGCARIPHSHVGAKATTPPSKSWPLALFVSLFGGRGSGLASPRQPEGAQTQNGERGGLGHGLHRDLAVLVQARRVPAKALAEGGGPEDAQGAASAT